MEVVWVHGGLRKGKWGNREREERRERGGVWGYWEEEKKKGRVGKGESGKRDEETQRNIEERERN